MAKIKQPNEVGKYIKERIAECKLTQAGLAEKMAILKEEEDIELWKKTIKTNISKWVSPGNDSRYPSTEYLYYLSQALKVSIEEILLCGETNARLDTRVTLYSAAKCSTTEQLEKLIQNNNEDISRLWDEDEKELIDYIIEFQNIVPLRYLIEKEYLGILDCSEFRTTDIQIYNNDDEKKHLSKILEIIIKHDDLDLFKKLVPNIVSVYIDDKKYSGHLFTLYVDENIVEQVLDTQNIFNYILKTYTPNKDQNPRLVRGQSYKKLKTEQQQLHGMFNILLNVAIKTNHSKLNELLDTAIKYSEPLAKYVTELRTSLEVINQKTLNPNKRILPILISDTTLLFYCLKNEQSYDSVIITFPNIYENFQNLSQDLRDKVEKCNELINQIR